MSIIKKTIPYRIGYLLDFEAINTLRTLKNVAQEEAKKVKDGGNYPHFDFAWDYSFDQDTLFLTVILAHLDPYDCDPGDLVYYPRWDHNKVQIPKRSSFSGPTLVKPGGSLQRCPNSTFSTIVFKQELIVVKQMCGSKFPFDTEIVKFDKYYKLC